MYFTEDHADLPWEAIGPFHYNPFNCLPKDVSYTCKYVKGFIFTLAQNECKNTENSIRRGHGNMFFSCQCTCISQRVTRTSHGKQLDLFITILSIVYQKTFHIHVNMSRALFSHLHKMNAQILKIQSGGVMTMCFFPHQRTCIRPWKGF